MADLADASSPFHVEPRGDATNDNTLGGMLAPIARRWKVVTGCAVVAGVVGFAGSFLITPMFAATTTFLPPQQQQSMAASALSSLGALATIGGASTGLKSPADEYVSLMQSVTVTDRMIERFKLKQLYERKYLRDTRKQLLDNVQMVVGKKDGMISVSVQDADPRRAAAMANQYVDELRKMTSVLAVSEAQQRRVFFESQMNATSTKLVAAQVALQESGFTSSAIKAEPKSAAEEYARLSAQMTATDVKLQTLRSSLTENAPDVQQLLATQQALGTKLAQLEQNSTTSSASNDYVTKYRDFKYQETLFDLLAKQYELARVDESREGALIQVVDPALPPELKSSPKRSFIGIGCALLGLVLSSIAVVIRERRRDVRAA